MGFRGKSPSKKSMKIPLASAHIHILRNNSGKFHDNLMDS